MSEAVNALREAYLESKKLCHDLGKLRDVIEDANEADDVEKTRQKAAMVHIEIWKELECAVMRDWCNATGTPTLGTLYPPKDMPKRA